MGNLLCKKKNTKKEELNVIGESYNSAGNDKFGKKLYLEAIEEYTKAITSATNINSKNDNLNDLNEYIAKYYSNRSNCLNQLKRYKEALEDSKKCISYYNTWHKGYIRKFISLKYLNSFDEGYNELLLGKDKIIASIKSTESASNNNHNTKKQVQLDQLNQNCKELTKTIILANIEAIKSINEKRKTSSNKNTKETTVFNDNNINESLINSKTCFSKGKYYISYEICINLIDYLKIKYGKSLKSIKIETTAP